MNWIRFNATKVILLVLCITSGFLCSCKKKDQIAISPTEQIEALVNMKDADIKTLSSMLGTSEIELNSVICGDTLPSAALEKRSNELYTFALEHGQSFKKLRAAYDPDFTWFDHILFSPTIHPWLFWIITGILAWCAIFRNVTLSFIRKSTVIYSDGLYLAVAKYSKRALVVEGLVFLIAYLFSTIL